MDTSIIISAISSIVACGALWVSYKAYTQSIKSQADEKILNIRVKAIELIFKITETKRRSEDLAKINPTKDDETIHEQYDIFTSKVEKIIKTVNDPGLKSKNFDLNNLLAQLHIIETTINGQHEKIIKFLEKA